MFPIASPSRNTIITRNHIGWLVTFGHYVPKAASGVEFVTCLSKEDRSYADLRDALAASNAWQRR